MPYVLAACDALVFPSAIDAWGLIVNEAMAAGLPVIVGAESGCAQDLVQDGVNGFLVPADDLDALKKAVGALVDNGDMRRRMGDASLHRIGSWSFRECHAGWRSALGLPPLSEN